MKLGTWGGTRPGAGRPRKDLDAERATAVASQRAFVELFEELREVWRARSRLLAAWPERRDDPAWRDEVAALCHPEDLDRAWLIAHWKMPADLAAEVAALAPLAREARLRERRAR